VKPADISGKEREYLKGNGDLLADSHTIVNRWKSYFSQLLNVHNVGIKQEVKC
jgi:hypothetical protein